MTAQPLRTQMLSRAQKLEALRITLRKEMERRGLDAPAPARQRLCTYCGQPNPQLRFAGCDPCREEKRPARQEQWRRAKLRHLAETIEKGER